MSLPEMGTTHGRAPTAVLTRAVSAGIPGAVARRPKNACAACNVALGPDDGMFASEGRICDACHASRARAEALRNLSAHHIHEGRLGAVFACVAAVGVFFVAAASRSLEWVPVRMLGPTLFAAVYAVYNAIVMVRRTRVPGVRGWPLQVSIGAAVVASLSFVVFGLWCMNPLEIVPP